MANKASAQGAALNVVLATMTALVSDRVSSRQTLTRSMSWSHKLGPDPRQMAVPLSHLSLTGNLEAPLFHTALLLPVEYKT